MYVGNNDGLLEFDGVHWRLIILPGRSTVQSLARDSSDRIWVGGLGDFGFITADSLGRAGFRSLRENILPDLRGFTYIYGTFAVETLINGVLAAGTHSSTWSAGNPPSGIYLYRLEVGGESSTRRMVLLK